MDWVNLGSFIAVAVAAMSALGVAWMKLYLPYRLNMEKMRQKDSLFQIKDDLKRAKEQVDLLTEDRRLDRLKIEELSHQKHSLEVRNAIYRERLDRLGAPLTEEIDDG